MSWRPHGDTKALLDFAMAQIQSVNYAVSVRWVYYRLVQAGIVEKSKVGLGKVSKALKFARKNFYGKWYPGLLSDTIRECYWRGEPVTQIVFREDTLKSQPCIVQVWFEARAMLQQIAYYTEPFRVSLVPFGGEVSIPIKWQIAKKIEQLSETYGKPVQVLYFGDYDKKGLSICKVALKDIASWCQTPFSFERIGLTLEQAHTFGLPENPDKPQTFQWEALTNQQAGKLIIDALNRFVKPIPQEIVRHEEKMEQWLRMQAND